MHRLALDIDPVTYVRNIMDDTDPDPVQAVVLAEMGGAESIVACLRSDLRTCNEHDIRLLKQVVKTHFNVRCNISDETIRKLMAVRVDMLTFTGAGDVSSIEPQPLNLDTHGSQVQASIAELRSNNILSSVLIEPELDQIKMAGRLEFDYVELDVHRLSEAVDMNTELDMLEEINSLATAANKLGMGVNVSGYIDYGNIRDLAQIEAIEDMVAGRAVFNKALTIGFEQAVRDMITLI